MMPKIVKFFTLRENFTIGLLFLYNPRPCIQLVDYIIATLISVIDNRSTDVQVGCFALQAMLTLFSVRQGFETISFGSHNIDRRTRDYKCCWHHSAGSGSREDHEV